MNKLLIAFQMLLLVFLVGCTNEAEYVGELQNGKPHGKGSITYENEEIYDGEWKEGLKEGKGTLTSPDGVNMKVNGRMTKWKVRELTPGLMGKSMKESGRMGKSMERVLYYLKMEVKWKVSSEMTVPGKLRFLTKTLLFTSLTTLPKSKVSKFVEFSQTFVRCLVL